MRHGLRALLAGACVALPTALAAAQTETTDWPCIQRKVPEISLAAAWQGPEIDESQVAALRQDPQVVALVRLLSARRTSDEEAKAAIEAFAEAAGEERREMLSAVVLGIFDSINAERAEIIAGIERFGRKLKSFAEQVREANARLDSMRGDPQADQVKLAEQTDEVLWELRVFDERQRSLRFVCEVPVIVEQRLFSLARMIQAAM